MSGDFLKRAIKFFTSEVEYYVGVHVYKKAVALVQVDLKKQKVLQSEFVATKPIYTENGEVLNPFVVHDFIKKHVKAGEKVAVVYPPEFYYSTLLKISSSVSVEKGIYEQMGDVFRDTSVLRYSVLREDERERLVYVVVTEKQKIEKFLSVVPSFVSLRLVEPFDVAVYNSFVSAYSDVADKTAVVLHVDDKSIDTIVIKNGLLSKSKHSNVDDLKMGILNEIYSFVEEELEVDDFYFSGIVTKELISEVKELAMEHEIVKNGNVFHLFDPFRKISNTTVRSELTAAFGVAIHYDGEES